MTEYIPVNSKRTDNLAAIFEATHDGRHVGMEWKIRRLKDVCFRPLNSCISTRKKAKNFQQYQKFNTKHVSRT
jgi:hypothetical protein